jgi:hypothetical protein
MPGGTNFPALGGLGCGSQTPCLYDAYFHDQLSTLVLMYVPQSGTERARGSEERAETGLTSNPRSAASPGEAAVTSD